MAIDKPMLINRIQDFETTSDTCITCFKSTYFCLAQLAGSLTEEIYFDFRKQRFIYSDEKRNFCKLSYPSKETFSYYLKSTGHGTEAKIQVALEKWGRNM